MTTARCDYCGQDVDSRLLKPVPDWRDGGVACYSCRGTESGDALVRQEAWKEFDKVAEQDRIDAARWRALRTVLRAECRLGASWVRSFRITAELNTVDEIVDKLVQIAQEQKQ